MLYIKQRNIVFFYKELLINSLREEETENERMMK